MPANSIQDILNSKVGTIQKITKQYGESSARGVVAFYISDMLSFMNLTRSMTQPQIAQLVDVLIDCYPDYTPEDYKRFTERFKKRQYGNLYEGVDGAKILEAIEIYDKEEREPELEAVRKQEKEADRNEPPLALELLDVLKDAIKPVAPVDLEIKAKPKREPTEHEKSVQRYMQEFDIIWLNKHDNDEQGPFKQIRLPGGEMVTMEQYINQRFNEEYGINQPPVIDLKIVPEVQEYFETYKNEYVKNCKKCGAMMVRDNDKYICKYC